MTDDDIKRLREAAQAATPGPWRASALDTDLHDRSEWTYVRGAGKNKCVYAGASVTSDAAHVALCPFDYADSPQGMRSPNAAYIAAASPAAILPLIDRLEAAERERDEARDSLALVAAERDALLADWNAVQDATLDDLCGLLVGVVVDRRDLRAERDALAALLARVVDQYGDDYRLTQRLMAEIGDALAAKEQSK